MLKHSLCLLLCICSGLNIGFAQENDPISRQKPTGDTKPGKLADPTKGAINFPLLVKSLRNENEKPRMVGGEPGFKANYNFEEQRRIHKVIYTLIIYTEEAWPELTANLDNQDYSYTIGFGDSNFNYSIGQVCGQIIRNTLKACFHSCAQLYEVAKLDSRGLENRDFLDPLKLRQWLISNQEKNIVELQLKTLEEFALRVDSLELKPNTKKLLPVAISHDIDSLNKEGRPNLSSDFIPYKGEMSFYLSGNK